MNNPTVILTILISLATLAVAIWVMVLIAKQFENAARDKGYVGKRYFWMCFLLGITGYLLVVALPDRGSNTKPVHTELPDL